MAFTKEQIRELLETNDTAVWRGVVSIFNNQTADEQEGESTRWSNGVGFSAFDAEILSSFAKQVIHWQSTPPEQRQYETPLSSKQMDIARKRIKRYAGQLAKIANQQYQEKGAA